MGSRILAAAKANSKVTICCAFMVLAAAGAYACPYASAAGIQTFGEYSGDGGIIQSNKYTSIQSTENIGFTKPGQETLSGAITDGLITVGRSGTRYNATVDANDHQIYKGDKSAQYLDGGMTWDRAYVEGSREPMAQVVEQKVVPVYNNTSGEMVNQTINVTPGDTVENTTLLQRPYDESMSVEKVTMGSRGLYVSDKVVEQGSNESQDYILLNAKATGQGSFTNDVETTSQIGFIGVSDNVNFAEYNRQHEGTYGNYSANSTTLLESFSDVYMNPSFNEEDMNLIKYPGAGSL